MHFPPAPEPLKESGIADFVNYTIGSNFKTYSHLFNKRGRGEKVAISLNMEVGINVQGGIFWKKLVHKCNKSGVEWRV